MSRHKVSRGNTSDLIGLWNNRATNPVEDNRSSGNFLSVNSALSPGKFRKTSAFAFSTTSKLEAEKIKDEAKFRKTSAMVLMPCSTSGGFSTRKSLNVEDLETKFKPMKNVSGLENGSSDIPKLTSALKLSTINAPKIQMDNHMNPNNNNRRGSVGLGRSKSVCHKVKFVPHISTESVSEGPATSSSPFAKFQQMDNQASSTSLSVHGSRLTRQASLPSLNEKKVSAPPPTGKQSSAPGGPSGGGLRRSTVVARSPSSAKEVILSWVQERTNTYPNINVTNFSTSWNDGMAFCALIHYYYPEAFDFEKLDPKNKKYNFDLAFKTAEQYADICPLLDVEDMLMFEKPDWKCVFTYVQTFFRRFRNGRDPPAPTKKLTLTPPVPAPNINLAKTID